MAHARHLGLTLGVGTRLGGKWGVGCHISVPTWADPSGDLAQGPREAWQGDLQSPWDLLGLNNTDFVHQKGPWDSSRLNPNPERGDLPTGAVYHK